MSAYEYRVVPAPTKGLKAKGVKTPEARFSLALQELMNQMGAGGWEYQRAETLPSVERAGLASTTTEWRNVLVFRRLRTAEAFGAEPLPVVETQAKIEPQLTDSDEEKNAGTSAGATRMLRDNGVEEVSDVSGITNSLKQLVANRTFKKSED